jgi:serine/threonine-protein kinase
MAALGMNVGDVLAGKYRIERVIGEGGMGVVVAAHHLQLDQKVAIKFLLPEMLTNPEIVARFAREARAAVRIKSEHVARVADVGTLENGAPYMVMEFLEGTDLSAFLQQQGRQSVPQAVEFTLQACEAIAEAHALGIVHRDLKPANLFVTRRADHVLSIKVLDFGISKVTTAGSTAPDANMTKTSMSLGSPLYMSPEQMASTRNVDERTDIWALGAILHEMLTCNAPFNGTTLPEICYKIATEPPAPLRTLRPDAPWEVEAVIKKCLEKQRTERYRNVAELAAALVDFGPPRVRVSFERISRTIQNAGGAVPAVAAPQPFAGPVATGKSSVGTMAPIATATGVKSRAPIAIGVVVALFIVAAGGGMLVRSLSGSSKASATGLVATAGSEHGPTPSGASTPAAGESLPVPPTSASVAAPPSAASTAHEVVPIEPPPPSHKAEPVAGSPARPPPRKGERPAAPPSAPATRAKAADDLGGRF